MSRRFGKPRKNTKRIDPRYFMSEKLEEQEKWENVKHAPKQKIKNPKRKAAPGSGGKTDDITKTIYDPAMDKTVTKKITKKIKEGDTSIPEEVNEMGGLDDNTEAMGIDEQEFGGLRGRADDAFGDLDAEMSGFDKPAPAAEKTTALGTAAKVGAKEDPEPVQGAAAKAAGSTTGINRTTTKTVDSPFGTGKKGTQTTTLRTGTGEEGKKISGEVARRGQRAPQQGESKEDYDGMTLKTNPSKTAQRLKKLYTTSSNQLSTNPTIFK